MAKKDKFGSNTSFGIDPEQLDFSGETWSYKGSVPNYAIQADGLSYDIEDADGNDKNAICLGLLGMIIIVFNTKSPKIKEEDVLPPFNQVISVRNWHKISEKEANFLSKTAIKKLVSAETSGDVFDLASYAPIEIKRALLKKLFVIARYRLKSEFREEAESRIVEDIVPAIFDNPELELALLTGLVVKPQAEKPLVVEDGAEDDSAPADESSADDSFSAFEELQRMAESSEAVTDEVEVPETFEEAQPHVRQRIAKAEDEVVRKVKSSVSDETQKKPDEFYATNWAEPASQELMREYLTTKTEDEHPTNYVPFSDMEADVNVQAPVAAVAQTVQPPAQRFEAPQAPVINAAIPQPPTQNFGTQRPAILSFDIPQPPAQNFGGQQPAVPGFDIPQPPAQNFGGQQPVVPSFDIPQPPARNFGGQQPAVPSIDPRQAQFQQPMNQYGQNMNMPSQQIPFQNQTPQQAMPPYPQQYPQNPNMGAYGQRPMNPYGQNPNMPPQQNPYYNQNPQQGMPPNQQPMPTYGYNQNQAQQMPPQGYPGAQNMPGQTPNNQGNNPPRKPNQ